MTKEELREFYELACKWETRSIKVDMVRLPDYLVEKITLDRVSCDLRSLLKKMTNKSGVDVG